MRYHCLLNFNRLAIVYARRNGGLRQQNEKKENKVEKGECATRHLMIMLRAFTDTKERKKERKKGKKKKVRLYWQTAKETSNGQGRVLGERMAFSNL